MKLRKRIRAALLAARIEYHWHFVLCYRKRGENLIGCGEPLHSVRILWLNKRIDRHGLQARKYEKRYRELYHDAANPVRLTLDKPR